MSSASVRKVALALMICGSSAGAATCKAPPTTHTVPIDGLAFQPTALTVKAGDSIVWINKDPFPHTVTSQAGGFEVTGHDAHVAAVRSASRMAAQQPR